MLTMNLLLLADDIAPFTTSPLSLLHQLDAIFNYSNTWVMEINVNKTKICMVSLNNAKVRVIRDLRGVYLNTFKLKNDAKE